MTIKAVIFDVGNTLLREFPQFFDLGVPMAEWPLVEALPGVPEALKELQTSYRCCVAANSVYPIEHMVKALHRAKIVDYFDGIFNSHEAGVAKPDPAFFKMFLEEMELQANEAVIVGDTYTKDIVPAKNLGFHTVLLREAFSATPVPAADVVISAMSELPDAVRKLSAK